MLQGRAGLELVTATAGHGDFSVLRMDARFHGLVSVTTGFMPYFKPAERVLQFRGWTAICPQPPVVPGLKSGNRSEPSGTDITSLGEKRSDHFIEKGIATGGRTDPTGIRYQKSTFLKRFQ